MAAIAFFPTLTELDLLEVLAGTDTSAYGDSRADTAPEDSE